MLKKLDDKKNFYYIVDEKEIPWYDPKIDDQEKLEMNSKRSRWIRKLVEKHKLLFEEKWHEYFGPR